MHPIRSKLEDLARKAKARMPSAARGMLQRFEDAYRARRGAHAEPPPPTQTRPAPVEPAAPTVTPVNWELRSQAELVDHIEQHYHAGLRRDLPVLIDAARRVEREHANHPQVPVGLAGLLESFASDASSDPRLAIAHLDSGTAPYAQTIRIGRHTLVADEPATHGGADAGASPFGLLLAGLAACTSITLRMYADRKGWDLGPVHVDAVIVRVGEGERIDRTIKLAPSVTAEQRARLAEIAEKTPVTKTLRRGTSIVTTLA